MLQLLLLLLQLLFRLIHDSTPKLTAYHKSTCSSLAEAARYLPTALLRAGGDDSIVFKVTASHGLVMCSGGS